MVLLLKVFFAVMQLWKKNNVEINMTVIKYKSIFFILSLWNNNSPISGAERHFPLFTPKP
jgi:hypothetical protein